MSMDVTLHVSVSRLPVRISKEQALTFWRDYSHLHARYMIMGARWRADESPEEDGWFEELGAEELESECFQDQFSEAELQLWTRR